MNFLDVNKNDKALVFIFYIDMSTKILIIFT